MRTFIHFSSSCFLLTRFTTLSASADCRAWFAWCEMASPVSFWTSSSSRCRFRFEGRCGLFRWCARSKQRSVSCSRSSRCARRIRACPDSPEITLRLRRCVIDFAFTSRTCIRLFLRGWIVVIWCDLCYSTLQRCYFPGVFYVESW